MLLQPLPHGCFLMHPTPWTADQKPAQAWQAQVRPGLPTTSPALAAAACPSPTPPPANCSPAWTPSRSRWGAGAEVCRQCTLPENTQATNSARTVASTLTALFAPDLVEAEQLLHFLKYQFHLPPGTRDIIYSTSAVDQVPVSNVVMSNSQPATIRVGAVMVRPAFGLCVASAGGRAESPRDRAARPPVVSHSAALPSGTSRATPAPDHLVAGASAAH